jgi:hypothetical protein
MPQRPHTGNSPNIIHSSTKRTPRFVDETELGNNKTRCSSEKDLLTRSEERNYTKNGQLAGLLSYQHLPTIGSSTHPINNRCSNTNIKPREKSSIGPQTAVPSDQLQSSIRDDEDSRQKVQQGTRFVEQRGQRHHRDIIHESCSYANMVTGVEDNKLHRPPNETSGGHQMDVYSSKSESSDDTSVLVVRESRRHQRDTVYRRRSFTNDKPTRDGRNDIYMSYGGRENLMEGKIISKQQTAHSTPSQIHEEGHVPMTKHPTCPRTCREVPNGPQVDIPLIQTKEAPRCPRG